MANRPLFTDSFGIARIASLSDGVFAIVVTLLVFDLKVPAGTSAENLQGAILALSPKFLSYIITFVLIGIYWVGHHAILRHVVSYDRPFLWLNVLFLLVVSFLPFPTSLVGTYPGERLAVIIYGVSLCLTGCALSLLWRHASRGHHLINKALSPQVIRLAHIRILSAPTVALLSIGSSYFSLTLSMALYVFGGILYFLPTRIDALSRHDVANTAE